MFMKRILLVDDELARADQAELFRARYQTEDYEFLFAKNTQEAAEHLASSGDISLILLDIVFDNIRDRNVLDTLRRISKEIWPQQSETLSGNEFGLPFLLTLRREFPSIPVVML